MLKATVLPNSTLSVDEIPVSDGVLFEEVEFFFPKSWEGYQKTAVFSCENTVSSVVLDPDNPLCTGENKCYIPHEFLTPKGFYLSVFGVLGESRATTTKVPVFVEPSGYALGDAPDEPTPDVYEQLIALANDTKAIALDVRADADNGEFNGQKGDKGDTGESGIYYGSSAPTDPKHPLWINPLGGGYILEQGYLPQSPNPISGKGVAEAINGLSQAVGQDISVLQLSDSTILDRLTALENREADIAALLSAAYPIGSIYLSYNHTNPSAIFGGTWERLQDGFLWGANEADTIGETGGEATHILTEAEMPSHCHQIGSDTNPNVVTYSQGRGTDNGTNLAEVAGEESRKFSYIIGGTYGSTDETQNKGGGQAHNNMPPYIKVSMWLRTA